MDLAELITVDSEILGGAPVFKGTRVPVRTLFEYWENDYTLEEFLECFPSVTREMAQIAAKYAGGRIVSSLEGGYSLSALGRSVAEHVRELITA